MTYTTHDAGPITTARGTCSRCRQTERPCWTHDGKRICAACVVKAVCAPGESVAFGGLRPRTKKSRSGAENTRAA